MRPPLPPPPLPHHASSLQNEAFTAATLPAPRAIIPDAAPDHIFTQPEAALAADDMDAFGSGLSDPQTHINELSCIMNAALDRDYAAAVSELLRHGTPSAISRPRLPLLPAPKRVSPSSSTLAGTSISSTPIPCLRFYGMHVFFTPFFLPDLLIAHVPGRQAAPYPPSQDTTSH